VLKKVLFLQEIMALLSKIYLLMILQPQPLPQLTKADLEGVLEAVLYMFKVLPALLNYSHWRLGLKMTTSAQVLEMLIPTGGYVTIGNDYEGIQFLECEPITKAEFQAGFAQYDAWQAEQDAAKAQAKTALLQRLGLTQEEFNTLTA